MPTSIRKSAIAESQQNRRRLAQLRDLGIDIGSADAWPPQFQAQERLRLDLDEEEPARIFTLPASNGYIFVARAKLLAPASGVLIRDYEMTTPWDDFPLELEEPEHFPFYADIVDDFYPERLTILNSRLVGEHSLDRRQREGLIIARGVRPVPQEYAEHSWLDLELSLWDENDEELRFEFRGRLNRKRLKTLDERQLRKQYPYRKPRKPLFDRDDEKAVSQGVGCSTEFPPLKKATTAGYLRHYQ